MDEKILIVAAYIAVLYDKGLCPDSVAYATASIISVRNLWDRLIEIEKSEGGYEKYVSEH